MCCRLVLEERKLIKTSNTEKEFNELSRREKRYIRRQAKRIRNLEKRNENITLDQVFTFDKLYRAGKKCCNGVRWKQSTQNFELHLLSRTAKTLYKIKYNNYKFSKYKRFQLKERGKTRIIDAPIIDDRQTQKLYTNEVLLPLYRPSMIKNNCASLKEQGLSMTFRLLKQDLRKHYKKYGIAGGILLADAKQFFPNANHQVIYDRHTRYIQDKYLKSFGDNILKTIPDKKGMPLGVEPSQAEMIGFPSYLDNFMKCQLGIKGYGHYMDDFYIIIPPGLDYKKIFTEIAKQNKIELNLDKTYYVPFTKPFRFCKAQFQLLPSGKIIMRANKRSIKKAKQKIKKLYIKLKRKEINKNDVYASINASMAYLKNYNEHNNILKLNRRFYSIFGYSINKLVPCNFKENFWYKDIEYN